MPFAESDFIVATLGEELGLTGLFAVLVLYLLLVERGLRTAIGVRDGFGKLLPPAWPSRSRCRCSWWSAGSPG